jgi:hypothetical protein
VLDAARWALARRGRETDPVTYAVPAGVEWLPLVENLNIALFHLPPSRRRAFDSYIGFVVAHEGEAVAYGGGWLFFHRATLGINIFPEFRGRDSAGLFEAIVSIRPRQRRGDRQRGVLVLLQAWLSAGRCRTRSAGRERTQQEASRSCLPHLAA